MPDPGHPPVARKATFYEVDQRLGDHFTVLFEGPPEQPFAERALEILEAAYWRVGTSLSFFLSAPITVVLHTEEQFRDITRVPQGAAGSFDGTIRGEVLGPSEVDHTFQGKVRGALTAPLCRWRVPRAHHPG